MLERDLKQIANILLLNGTLTKCPGLVQGKIGIAIFFFHYARYVKNTLFDDYAFALIRELLGQIHANYRADYEKGIAGIGIGIEYLINNGFLDADRDIFEDLDERMYRAVQYDPYPNFSMYEGLSGYGRYWIFRLQREPSSTQAKNCLLRITEQIKINLQDIPTEDRNDVYCFLHDLQICSDFDISHELLAQFRERVIDRCEFFPHLGDSSVNRIAKQYLYGWYFNEISANEIEKALKQIPDLDNEKISISTGLLTGYAGEGLLRLTALHAIDLCWMRLL